MDRNKNRVVKINKNVIYFKAQVSDFLHIAVKAIVKPKGRCLLRVFVVKLGLL